MRHLLNILKKKKEFTGWEAAPAISFKTMWDNEGLKDFVLEVMMKKKKIKEKKELIIHIINLRREKKIKTLQKKI